jgi:hypothetical protein
MRNVTITKFWANNSNKLPIFCTNRRSNDCLSSCFDQSLTVHSSSAVTSICIEFSMACLRMIF